MVVRGCHPSTPKVAGVSLAYMSEYEVSNETLKQTNTRKEREILNSRISTFSKKKNLAYFSKVV